MEIDRAHHEQTEFQRRVDLCEEDRRRQAKAREAKEVAAVQRRQHATNLKTMAERVEEQLAEDKAKIEEMIALVAGQDRLKAEEKEKTLKEVRWMQGVLADQQREEQRRRQDMELMFAEEAEKMWNKQQEIWDRCVLFHNEITRLFCLAKVRRT